MRFCLLLLSLFNLFLVSCVSISQAAVATNNDRPATVSRFQSPLPTSTLPPFTISRDATPPVTTPMPTNTLTPTLILSELPRLKGDFSNQIAGLKRHIPPANSERFIVPTEAETILFVSLMTNIAAGDSLKAAQIASQQGYELVLYTDRGDGRAQSFLLRELKPIRRGWGLYAFRANPLNNIIIEAPHPLFDQGTPEVALAVYRALNAKALLIAGTHRRANRDRAADVAQNDQTIFHTLHQVLTDSENPIVLQIHGFSADKHPDYPQVILNSNHGTSLAVLNRLADAFSAAGLQVEMCTNGWDKLCGRTNVQLSSMEQGVFIHLELAESVRYNNKALLNAIITADLNSVNSLDAIQQPK